MTLKTFSAESSFPDELPSPTWVIVLDDHFLFLLLLVVVLVRSNTGRSRDTSSKLRAAILVMSYIALITAPHDCAHAAPSLCHPALRMALSTIAHLPRVRIADINTPNTGYSESNRL